MSCSIWYCEYKIKSGKKWAFGFGKRHAWWLSLWFSIGIGFSLTALVSVSLIMALDAFKFHNFLLGFSPWMVPPSYSLVDAFYLLASTVVSVAVHEFGHAVAAASVGVPTEYVAIFVAFLFPGALVAFDSELLQRLPPLSALRLYCAGIWHNAVCCAVCALILFLLPPILYPFYIRPQNPMVLNVPLTSPLSGYLSPGDVIISLDGKGIRNEWDWMEMTALLDKQALRDFNYSKGYCVPASLIDKYSAIDIRDDQSACPTELTEFISVPCSNSNEPDKVNNLEGDMNRMRSKHCLNPKDIVKLNKCGDGWVKQVFNGSSCPCSQDESCLSPVQAPGMVWAEINYSSPFSPGCSQLGMNMVLDSENAENSCGGTFVFVGDATSMAHSVQLTAYRPRWAFNFVAHLPCILEKCLMCIFHVSAALALLNSLPVYCLDGESILEAALCHFTTMKPRTRAKLLKATLTGGTLLSLLSLLRFLVAMLRL